MVYDGWWFNLTSPIFSTIPAIPSRPVVGAEHPLSPAPLEPQEITVPSARMPLYHWNVIGFHALTCVCYVCVSNWFVQKLGVPAFPNLWLYSWKTNLMGMPRCPKRGLLGWASHLKKDSHGCTSSKNYQKKYLAPSTRQYPLESSGIDTYV